MYKNKYVHQDQPTGRKATDFPEQKDRRIQWLGNCPVGGRDSLQSGLK